MDKVVVNVNPEFSYELVCAAPYAYWLHQKGVLEKVITCEGMSPFYYFCENIEEIHKQRSIDNYTNGIQNLPNTWIHHNANKVMGKRYDQLTKEEQIQVNGVLDYSQWTPPPYKEIYYDSNIKVPEKYVVISNRYNKEHGQPPVGYFDIESLYHMFDYFSNKGYDVIYKRPKNTEFVTDENEWEAEDIIADVKDYGLITDFDLVKHFDNVHLLDDVIETIGEGYNTSQLKIFARSSGFISMGGGSSILCSYFKVPVIIYVNVSKDVRPGYFEGDTYFRKLSNAPIYPVVDKKDDIIARGYRDYSQVYKSMEKAFK